MRRLPVDALRAWHEIEVAVAAEKWEGVLAAEGGDPEVVGGDGPALAFEFENDLGIVLRGGLVDVQDEAILEEVREPVFVGGAVA